MLKKLNRHKFLFCLLGILFLCVSRIIYYYVNGQSIASAHLGGHNLAFQLNFFIAVIIFIIFFIIYKIKKQDKILKWFFIPIIIVAFAPFHIYIESLFECCSGG